MLAQTLRSKNTLCILWKTIWLKSVYALTNISLPNMTDRHLKVRDTLFRVPLNYLTDNSRYFARLVEESPMATESLCIYDDDVVVEAFAHLVHAIRTP